MTGVFRMGNRLDDVYPPALRAQFASRLTMVDGGDAEVMITGWGAPRLDAPLLREMPSLRLVLYGAGSIRGIVTDEFWEREIPIVSAWAANAVPVAEFTVAAITFALKGVFRNLGQWPAVHPIVGGYGARVGIVSLGMIGRMVVERLRAYDYRVLAYDPFTTVADAEMVSLPELFATADVVSLHTPWLRETEGMIDASLLGSMRSGATLINTSRGAVVNESDLIRVLAERPDLTALLDVTHPEPPSVDSPLRTLPNVFLTPHIAGAVGNECVRLGETMLAELDRFLAGEPLRYRVTQAMSRTMA